MLFYNSYRDRAGLFLLLPIIAYFIFITGPLGPEATFRYPRLLLSVFGFLVFCGIVGTLRLFFSVSMV